MVQIKLTFKDGGAYDFHSTFERIKEQVSHAAEIARESGRPVTNNTGPIDVDLEQLPAYEEVGSAPPQPDPVPAQADPTQVQRPIPIAPNGKYMLFLDRRLIPITSLPMKAERADLWNLQAQQDRHLSHPKEQRHPHQQRMPLTLLPMSLHPDTKKCSRDPLQII